MLPFLTPAPAPCDDVDAKKNVVWSLQKNSETKRAFRFTYIISTKSSFMASEINKVKNSRACLRDAKWWSFESHKLCKWKSVAETWNFRFAMSGPKLLWRLPISAVLAVSMNSKKISRAQFQFSPTAPQTADAMRLANYAFITCTKLWQIMGLENAHFPLW